MGLPVEQQRSQREQLPPLHLHQPRIPFQPRPAAVPGGAVQPASSKEHARVRSLGWVDGRMEGWMGDAAAGEQRGPGSAVLGLGGAAA